MSRILNLDGKPKTQTSVGMLSWESARRKKRVLRGGGFLSYHAHVGCHGPSMMEKMKEQSISWPEFTGSEMTDLITYLNSKLVLRLAHSPIAAAR